MKYEYQVKCYGGSASPAELQESFNALGQEGWRLVAVTEVSDNGGASCGTTAYFIRATPI